MPQIFDISSLTPHLPSHDDLFNLLLRVTSLYEDSRVPYRPVTKDGVNGGLLDFRADENLPLIIVPDLHARLFFLQNILLYKLPVDFACGTDGEPLSVVQALEKRLIRVVCVGDGLHSESRGKERWLKAWDDFTLGKNAGRFMKQEMAEGLTLMSLVMQCKCSFPDVFHFLKGNHENIESSDEGGDYPFHKYVQESIMTRRFMVEYYGDDILYLYSCFEKDLPLAAVFNNCIVSHAEPQRAFSLEELIECKKNPKVVEGLIWTGNGDAEQGSAEKMLADFTDNAENSVYFAGHRPIYEKFNYPGGNKFLQIHNPDEQNVCLVYPGKIFNPETDIVSVESRNAARNADGIKEE